MTENAVISVTYSLRIRIGVKGSEMSSLCYNMMNEVFRSNKMVLHYPYNGATGRGGTMVFRKYIVNTQKKMPELHSPHKIIRKNVAKSDIINKTNYVLEIGHKFYDLIKWFGCSIENESEMSWEPHGKIVCVNGKCMEKNNNY